jgi:hypothetical protein
MGNRAIIHWELPSANGEATRKFYADLCGWEFQHSDFPEYWGVTTGSVGGGLAPLGEEVKPGDVMLYTRERRHRGRPPEDRGRPGARPWCPAWKSRRWAGSPPSTIRPATVMSLFKPLRCRAQDSCLFLLRT